MGLEDDLTAALTKRRQERTEAHARDERHRLLRAAADERLQQAAVLLAERRVPTVDVEAMSAREVTVRKRGLFGRTTTQVVNKSDAFDRGWLMPFPQSVLHPSAKAKLILLTDGYLGKVNANRDGGLGFERAPDRSADRLSALETDLAWQDLAHFNGPVRAGDLMLGMPDSPQSRDPVTLWDGFDAWFLPALAAILEP